ncbi:hypothetical protein Bbelb_346650 [Branchiostoma belcheri]|nr:hypothetical protein Bbelb_346650 [Branchiostoma belcheri]
MPLLRTTSSLHFQTTVHHWLNTAEQFPKPPTYQHTGLNTDGDSHCDQPTADHPVVLQAKGSRDPRLSWAGMSDRPRPILTIHDKVMLELASVHSLSNLQCRTESQWPLVLLWVHGTNVQCIVGERSIVLEHPCHHGNKENLITQQFNGPSVTWVNPWGC